MKKIVYGALAYVAASFLVQAVSHFALFKSHFDSIPFVRKNPWLPAGVSVLLLQGLVLSYLYESFHRSENPIRRGWQFGMLAALFLVSYIAIVEPSKYTVPSFAAWAGVEGAAGLIQFSLFGLALGWIYKQPPS